jgi:hypothetical protein
MNTTPKTISKINTITPINLSLPVFESDETCEFSRPRINGKQHSEGSNHISGFILCNDCQKFMNQLATLTSKGNS